MSSLQLLCNYSVHIIRTPVDSGVELLTNSLQKGLRKLDLNIRNELSWAWVWMCTPVIIPHLRGKDSR